MITFYGEVTLTTMAAYTCRIRRRLPDTPALAGYAGACWLISKLPSKPKRTIKQAEQDHGLHGSNRERAINQSYNWR